MLNSKHQYVTITFTFGNSTSSGKKNALKIHFTNKYIQAHILSQTIPLNKRIQSVA